MSEQHHAARTESTASVALLADKLSRQPNVCDQRKGRDLKLLHEASQGIWQEFLSDLRIAVGTRQSLLLTGRLKVGGLVWADQARIHNDWGIEIMIPRHYPIAQPEVRMESPVPYNPHVLHNEFLPDERELPAELRPFLEEIRAGAAGRCCYLGQWQADLTHDLRLVVWQISRILSGACFHGEANSLNNHARDYYLRLKKQGGLPIAAALPVVIDETATDRTGDRRSLEMWDGEPGDDADVLWSVKEGD
jgi:hypothetical protein